jgi:RNA polymerase sigma-70 factor (ECF subfamily)
MTAPKRSRHLTDQELVVLALQDDDAAMGELYRRYRERVYSAAQAIVEDPDDADSVTQHTFIRVDRYLDNYDPEYSFAAWLVRIAKNAALDRVKKRKAAAKVAMDVAADLDTDELGAPRFIAMQVAEARANPLQHVLANEKVDQLRHALTYLKPKHQEAMLLHLEGLRDQEVADQMGVPVSTARSYLKRAKDGLKPIMRAMRGSDFTKPK